MLGQGDAALAADVAGEWAERGGKRHCVAEGMCAVVVRYESECNVVVAGVSSTF